MSSPKDFHIDAVYPEHLSRLRRTTQQAGGGGGGGAGKGDYSPAAYRRAVKKQLHRGSSSGRFRTQPITFQEIQEVDEENVPDCAGGGGEGEAATAGSAGAIYNQSETDLKAKFELFYRSISNPNDNKSRTAPVPCKQQSTTESDQESFMESPLRSSKNNTNSSASSNINSSAIPGPSTFNAKSRPSI